MLNSFPETQSQEHTLKIIEFSDDDIRSPPCSRKNTLKPKKGKISSFDTICDTHSIDHTRGKTEEVPQVLLVRCDKSGLRVAEDDKARKLMESRKMKFVVEVLTGQEGEERLTVVDKVVHTDTTQCKYLLLRCYISSQQTPFSQPLLKLSYEIAIYLCLLDVNEKTISLLSDAVKTLKPPLWKWNHLVLAVGDEEERSTSYETATNNETLQHLSETGERHLQTSNFGQKMDRSRQLRMMFSDMKHAMLNYFTNVSSACYLSKVVTLIHQEKPKGLYYQLSDLVTLAERVTSNSLDMEVFETGVLKSNLQYKVDNCKMEYMGLSKSIYSCGKSIEFMKLRVFLSEIYSSVVDSLDRELSGFESLEDYEIHRSILKRWIQTQEQNILQLNAILHEHQSIRVIEAEVGKGLDGNLNVEQFLGGSLERSYGISIDALVGFLRGSYMVSIRKRVEQMEGKHKRLILRQINYYQNPGEVLKNCEQRLGIFKEKKEYLIKCMQLVEKEIENLDNLFHGLNLQEQKEIPNNNNITHERGVFETFPEGWGSSTRNK